MKIGFREKPKLVVCAFALCDVFGSERMSQKNGHEIRVNYVRACVRALVRISRPRIHVRKCVIHDTDAVRLLWYRFDACVCLCLCLFARWRVRNTWGPPNSRCLCVCVQSAFECAFHCSDRRRADACMYDMCERV